MYFLFASVYHGQGADSFLLSTADPVILAYGPESTDLVICCMALSLVTYEQTFTHPI